MNRTVALALLAALPAFLGGEAHRRTEKGNALYEKGRQDAALEEYGKAQAVAPAAPELPYDIGNVLYRQKNYAGAAEAYRKALGEAPPALAPRVAYNLGNALFQDKKYDDAVKAYVRSLRAAPHDADAKRNLELALRALQEEKQQQKQGGKQGQQQQQKPKPEPKGQQGRPGDEKDEAKGSGRPSPSQGGRQSEADEGAPSPPGDRQKPGEPGRMTPDEANRLLDRVAALERDAKKSQPAKTAGPGDVTREKDW